MKKFIVGILFLMPAYYVHAAGSLDDLEQALTILRMPAQLDALRKEPTNPFLLIEAIAPPFTIAHISIRSGYQKGCGIKPGPFWGVF